MDILKKYRGQLFILVTMSSIVLTTLFCGVNIKYTIALILLTNQAFSRDVGWHSKSLSHCWVLSLILFTLFSYLSSIIIVSPIVVIIAMTMLDYDKIRQHTILIIIFVLGISNVEYSWLMSSCLFSIILSYLLSGSNKIVIGMISKVDNALYKILK
jgi:hypothetical protein